MMNPQVQQKWAVQAPPKLEVYSIGLVVLPSGKLSHNYGKIHHVVAGKIHDFYGHFQ